jgi:hypothetical protein
MIGTKEIRGGIVDAVAAARDEALVEMGRKAALRQEVRHAQSRRTTNGGLVIAAVAAGAALAAGAVAYQVRNRRKQNGAIGTNGHPAAVNGTTSEHEHQEAFDEEVVPSKR